MKTFVTLQAVVCTVALLLPTGRSLATDPGISSKPAKCDGVAEKVTAEVKKDPHKVLLVVEDFMVSDQACAAAIVKAAIEAAHADAELRKQIAITATHIAPEMAKAIEDTVAALAPADAGAVEVAVQKEAASESPQTAQNTTGDNSNNAGNDYNLPTDLRAVFFIEPINTGGGAVITTTSSNGANKNKNNNAGPAPVHVVNVVVNNPPNHPAPLSPSSGSP